jgi:hypothetical protein
VFIELLLVLAVDPYPHLPPLADVRRFPSADVCAEQIRRHERHLEWLEGMEPTWPERREWFAAWKVETESSKFLWVVLKETAVRSRMQWLGEEQHRRDLDRYRWLVGPELYDRVWTPPEIPACLYPEMKKCCGTQP